MSNCVVPDCKRADIKARGLCNVHYQWAKYRGILDTFVRKTRPVEGRLCEADSCEKPVKKTGGRWCSMHQNRLYAGRPKKTQPPCVVEGCSRLSHHGALCSMHAERLRRTGDIGTVEAHHEKHPNQTCSVGGCERKPYGRSFCTLHYARFKKTGNPGPAGLIRAPSGAGCVELGYRRFAAGKGKRRSEHTMVWEEANGPLPDGYVIHHKNHDKLDNRLENLEAMTRSAHVKLHNRWNTKNRASAKGANGD